MIEMTCTAYSRKEVVIEMTGLPSGAICSFYRYVSYIEPSSKTWTTEEILAENVSSKSDGTCIFHCYNARTTGQSGLAGDWYYCKVVVGSGEPEWYNSGIPIQTMTFAEELKDDYTPQSLNVATTQQAIVTIQNNSGAVNFSSIPVDGGKKIAVVCLQKDSGDFSDRELALLFKSGSYSNPIEYKFQLIATSSPENISGKTPALSGYLKLNYNNTGAQ